MQKLRSKTSATLLAKIFKIALFWFSYIPILLMGKSLCLSTKKEDIDFYNINKAIQVDTTNVYYVGRN
ncbi:hypothetical protein B5E73_04345 [Ligilactobacillus salivarius]|nr:hypothetical protein B5E73_04345 [Ligilactobacillus salivarius]